MTKKQKRNLIRIIVSLCLFAIIFVVDLTIGLGSVIQNEKIAWLLPFSLYFAVYIVIGYDVLFKAARNICHGQVFDENFLMCIATFGAFGIQKFAEGVAILLFYQVGEWFQNYAVAKSRKSISSLMDIRPDYANLKNSDGDVEVVDPCQVKIGDIIIVKPGEKIPLDGVVVSGCSAIDTKALTGESLPADVAPESKVISGTINLTGTLEIRVEKEFYDSTVSKILNLVQNTASNKSKSENFITKFSKWYTPTVVFAAIVLLVVGGCVTSDWIGWTSRALNFLVVSCPCALVISIPLSFFAGIGGASKDGVLFKSSQSLEKAAQANIFVFDKTGTLTKGNFAVVGVYPEEKRNEILKLAAIAERDSIHPIALSIKNEYGKAIRTKCEFENVAGKGVIAKTSKQTIYCGNEKLMQQIGAQYLQPAAYGTVVYVACDQEYVGAIVIEDEIRDEAKRVISYLNSTGAKTVMLTGDNEANAMQTAAQLGIAEVEASLLPQDKVSRVEKLLQEKGKRESLCFVGDGINDAPVLMAADVGVSLGGVGSDAAIEAADIVLMHDNLDALISAEKVAKKTLTIVKENIYFAIAVKLLVLGLSAFGLVGMWLAIAADVGVSVLAILNAMRSLFKQKRKINAKKAA